MPKYCLTNSEKICCGTIFKGPNGQILVDSRFLKPCNARVNSSCKTVPQTDKVVDIDIAESTSSKLYSDSSSDSGYDESSNQGLVYLNNSGGNVKKEEGVARDSISEMGGQISVTN